MTAPTINGTRYPQPVEDLLPAARKLADELGDVPSRNRLMREFRIGAPKADELRTRLIEEKAQEIGTQEYEEHLRRRLAEKFDYTPPDERPAEREPLPHLPGLDGLEMVRAAVDLADRRGATPTAEQLAEAFGIDVDRAGLLASLAEVARQRRAAGLPVDLGESTAEEPPVDPWDYAEPIGPESPAEYHERAREDIHGRLEEAKQAGRLTGFGIHPDRPGPTGADPTGDVPGYAPVGEPGTDAVDIPLDDDAPATPQPPQTAVQTAPDTRVRIDTDHAPEVTETESAAEPIEQVETVGHPGTKITSRTARPLPVWPVWLLMLPAFVAVWAGWVELGKLTGFGPVDLLPGFTRDNGEPLATLDTAITLPIGMETYAGYALYVWLSGRTTGRAKRFAMTSALIALTLGGGAQITYHLLTRPDTGAAPWQITTVVACLPVVVLGMGAALGHLVREETR